MEDKQTNLRNKVAAWRQQVEAHQARMLRSYYAAKPSRRDHIFRLVRPSMGGMMASVLEAEKTQPAAERKE